MQQGENLSYASMIGAMNNTLKTKKSLECDVATLRNSLIESQTLFVKMLNAQKILSTVADENTTTVLNFITGMINKVLSEIFPHDIYTVSMTRKLYAGCRPHVNIELRDAEDHILDSSVQCGTGLNQIISFMYVLCLIEIRKGRQLLIFDEKLNGLHKVAKDYIKQIMNIFVEGGFQFVFSEYSLNNIGKTYNVERKGNESTLISVEGDYDDNCVFLGDVDLSVLDEDYNEDEEVEVPLS